MKLSAEDRLDILDVIARYNLTADEKDVEGMLAHYTEDGLIDGDMSTGQGKEAMREALPGIFDMEGTLKRHLVTNVRFEASEDTNRATVHYLLLVVEGEVLPGVGATAQVTDEFRREDGRWLVARHHLKVDPAMFNAIRQSGATGEWIDGDPSESSGITSATVDAERVGLHRSGVFRGTLCYISEMVLTEFRAPDLRSL